MAPSTASFSNRRIARNIIASALIMERRYLRRFLAAINKTGTNVQLVNLLNDAVNGKFQAVTPEVLERIEGLEIETIELVDVLRQAMVQAGQVTANSIGLNLDFNINNPRAISAARSIGSSATTAINNTTKEVLRMLVGDVIESDMTLPEAKRLIRREVGLLPSHVIAVNNYQAQLLAAGSKKGAARKLTDEYAGRLKTYRANMIARTEVAQAVSIGQLEYWKQAQDAEVVPSNAMRVWITALDERTCPICAPMNGQEATINGVWFTGSGEVSYPSAVHPQCRCTSGLVFPDEVGKVDHLGYEKWLIKKGRPDILKKGDYTGHPFRGNQWTTSTGAPVSFAPGMKDLTGVGPSGEIVYVIGREGQKAIITDLADPKSGDDQKEMYVEGMSAAEALEWTLENTEVDQQENLAMNLAIEVFEFDMVLDGPRTNIGGGTFPDGTKLEVRVSDATVNNKWAKGYVDVDLQIFATDPATGNQIQIGTAQRTLKPSSIADSGIKGIVDNDYFSLTPVAQGAGIGTQVLSHWEDQYARAGFGEMTVSATSSEGSMNGAYTWAKYGYEPSYGTTNNLLAEYMMDGRGTAALNQLGTEGSISALTKVGYKREAVLGVIEDGYSYNESTGVETINWNQVNEGALNRLVLFGDGSDTSRRGRPQFGEEDTASGWTGDDLIAVTQEIPGFSGFLQNSSVSWSGTKQTRIRERAVPKSAFERSLEGMSAENKIIAALTKKDSRKRGLPVEVLDTIDRFMAEDPQAIERDEPQFFEALHRARLEARRNGNLPRVAVPEPKVRPRSTRSVKQSGS